MDFTELIKKNIALTAVQKNNSSIDTVENMIPPMDDSAYTHKILDIPYGKRREEKLDIYYPEEPQGKYPVFIEVHGGAWYFGQKRSVEFEPFLLGLERGYACVSLEYSRAPYEHYPLPVLEIKSAIRYLRANAEKYHLDSDRIVLWGGSAGAHLVALAATSCDTGYLEEDINGITGVSAKPQVLVSWYGCYDYYDSDRYLEEWIYQNFFGVDDLSTIHDTLLLSNPMNHVTKDICPLMLQHGRSDSVVPYTQSVKFYDKVKEVHAEDRCCYEILPGLEHADAYLFSKENVQHMFEFVEKYI